MTRAKLKSRGDKKSRRAASTVRSQLMPAAGVTQVTPVEAYTPVVSAVVAASAQSQAPVADGSMAGTSGQRPAPAVDRAFARPTARRPNQTQVPTDEGPPFIAYVLEPETGLDLVPAPRMRAWMEGTPDHFANRCLPLLIANQAGWVVLNNAPVQITWDGGTEKTSITIEYEEPRPRYPAMSHFGSGIVTWSLPFLFRTPAGYNLHARGPVNWPKDGIQALEGIVETDWASSTFTMNWIMTRAGVPVTFAKGEPICMLVPQRRGELEAFRPELRDLRENPEDEHGYRAFQQSRSTFLRELREPGSTAAEQRWEKHYFSGRTADGSLSPEHQTKLHVREFVNRAEKPS